ncbi:MAG: F0F1 ATP synthase subunit B [Halanaerobiales bacterium]
MININWTLIWNVINFFILMYLLKRFLYQPLLEVLDKRTAKIEGDLKAAADEKEEARLLKEQYEAEMARAREKALEIIAEAEMRGKERAREIINEAKEEARRIREKNLEEIQLAREEARAQLKEEIATISLFIAGKYLQEQLQKEQQLQLIEKYINSLDRGKLGEV